MTSIGRYAALALLAGGGLLYEIALTRVLSVLWFDSFVYVLLSIAVLGIGLGAAAATAFPGLRRAPLLPLWFALAGVTAAGLVPVLIAAAYAGDRVLGYLLVTLPYAFLGLALASLFSLHPEASPRLYLADLAGAGLGGLAAAPVLSALGGIGAALVAAAAIGLGAPLIAASAPRTADSDGVSPETSPGGMSPRPPWWAWVGALAPVAVLALHVTAGWPGIDWRHVSTPKPITEALGTGGRVAATRWDALARTDLVLEPATGARFVYLDGGAGSLVPDPTAADRWESDVGAFAFEVVRPERAFLLGSGGGLDIALARRAGATDIVAAEVNRASVELSRELEPELYEAPVRVLIDEGRSALRREGLFDLVLLSQTVTQNAELHGLALTENALYTVEAFRTYLSHLDADGAVALKLYDELTLTRALTTALAALVTDGRTEAEALQHLVAVLDPRASPPIPLLLVRKQAFTRDDAVAAARTAERLGYALLLVPGLVEPPPLDAIAAGRAGIGAIVANSPEADLEPPYDRRPFFWQFEPGVPRSLRPLLWTMAAALALGLAAYGLRWRASGPSVRAGVPIALLLGIGFMLAEIALLQRVQLMIGKPTLALGASLGTLLAFAGIGSALSDRWWRRPFRTGAVAAGSVVLALVAAEAAWPAISAVAGAWPTPTRLLAALVPVALVALPLGVPFPHLLRALGRSGATPHAASEGTSQAKSQAAPHAVPHAAPHPVDAGSPARVAGAWALNGFGSVAGAVGATALAVVAGFPAVAAAAVACYGVATLVFILADRSA